ncbi:MAG TPA: hypothetical protein VK772_05305 [Puia sp.]|jgi:hypothetical protein|nr:hypothetical protein [Puia sp.]
MRAILLIFLSAGFFSVKAQTFLPVGSMNFGMWQPRPVYFPTGDSNHLNQKFYFNTYSGVSTGVSFFNGGSVTYVSAPIGLQVTRPLNDNVSAFAAISIAPTFYGFGNSFMNPSFNKSYPGAGIPNTYGFGVNPAVQMGLMYTNDAKTFSISGSIGVERTSYPVYYPQRTNTKK